MGLKLPILEIKVEKKILNLRIHGTHSSTCQCCNVTLHSVACLSLCSRERQKERLGWRTASCSSRESLEEGEFRRALGGCIGKEGEQGALASGVQPGRAQAKHNMNMAQRGTRRGWLLE